VEQADPVPSSGVPGQLGHPSRLDWLRRLLPSSGPRPQPAPPPSRIGIVFVHGIGAQAPSGTLLDWSAPIVELLTDWRADEDRPALRPGDPVVRGEFDLTGHRTPFLELEIPEYAGHDAQTWILTETWWAEATRPPSLGTMTAYLRGAVWKVAGGIRRGYDQRQGEWRQESRQARDYAETAQDYEHRDLVLGSIPASGRDWIDWLDLTQMRLTNLALAPICFLIWLVMIPYAAFRGIPIQALKDSTTLKSLDSFLTGWFGGLPNISRDNIQSANVRARLATSIAWLKGQGCDAIIVVAHSGGAVVSFETLCDCAYDLRVDKLITLGEGLDLAWRIERAYSAGGLPGSSRLRGDLEAAQPALKWVNFWSTYDPAPAGPVQRPDDPEIRFCQPQDQVTVNRMSLLEDHGGYWDNDEDFLIPLVQQLDTPRGDSSQSRFFRDSSVATVRSAWRRQRVAALALWRWTPSLEAIGLIAVTTVVALLGWRGLQGPGRLGADVAGWWATVPGHELIVTPLNSLAGVTSWPAPLQPLGEWILGVSLIAVAFLVLARVGIARWNVWDRRERRDARRKKPVRRSRFVPVAQLSLLGLLGFGMVVGFAALMWR
jgi:hypothetical protein